MDYCYKCEHTSMRVFGDPSNPRKEFARNFGITRECKLRRKEFNAYWPTEKASRVNCPAYSSLYFNEEPVDDKTGRKWAKEIAKDQARLHPYETMKTAASYILIYPMVNSWIQSKLQAKIKDAMAYLNHLTTNEREYFYSSFIIRLLGTKQKMVPNEQKRYIDKLVESFSECIGDEKIVARLSQEVKEQTGERKKIKITIENNRMCYSDNDKDVLDALGLRVKNQYVVIDDTPELVQWLKPFMRHRLTFELIE